jgi:hypothetical protein
MARAPFRRRTGHLAPVGVVGLTRGLFRRRLAEATKRATQDWPNPGGLELAQRGGRVRLRLAERDVLPIALSPADGIGEQLWLVQGAGHPASIYPDRRTGENAFAVHYSDTAMMLAMARSPQWPMLVSRPAIPRRSAIYRSGHAPCGRRPAISSPRRAVSMAAPTATRSCSISPRRAVPDDRSPRIDDAVSARDRITSDGGRQSTDAFRTPRRLIRLTFSGEMRHPLDTRRLSR